MGLNHIDRGYEDMEEKLRSLGGGYLQSVGGKEDADEIDHEVC